MDCKEKRFTGKDLKTCPLDECWELIEGEAFAMSSPTTDHQRYVLKLGSQLLGWFRGKSCEPFVAPLNVKLLDFSERDEDKVDTVLLTEVAFTALPTWFSISFPTTTVWRD